MLRLVTKLWGEPPHQNQRSRSSGSPELLVQEARQPSDRRIAVIDHCLSLRLASIQPRLLFSTSRTTHLLDTLLLQL
jgi:hypothetical protein